MSQENQEAINRHLNQILEAKKGAGQSGLSERDKQPFYDMSNQAREALDALGYTGHAEGAFAKGTSYDTAMQGHLQNQWQQQADAMYQQQASQIEASRQNQINAIERAYQQAVADGELSQAEAQRQFEANREAIMESSYRDSQLTNLNASNLGISNSQQMLGLQAGDNARRNRNETTAQTARDTRINEIKTRISQISNQKNLDTANINAQADQALIGARAGVDSQLFGQMADFNAGNYQIGQQQSWQEHMAQQQHNWTLEQMAEAHGYDLSKMTQQQRYALEQMAIQQGYTQDNMNLQHGLDLSKMKTQHGYDLDKISVQFDNQLIAMAKQHGYDMSKISQQQKNAMAQISAQRQAQMEQAERQYQQERQRIHDSYYNKNSQEYAIRMGQLDEANNQRMQEIQGNAIAQSMAELGTGHWGWQTWMTDPGAVLNDPGRFTAPNQWSSALKGRSSPPGLSSIPQVGGQSFKDDVSTRINPYNQAYTTPW